MDRMIPVANAAFKGSRCYPVGVCSVGYGLMLITLYAKLLTYRESPQQDCSVVGAA